MSELRLTEHRRFLQGFQVEAPRRKTVPGSPGSQGPVTGAILAGKTISSKDQMEKMIENDQIKSLVFWDNCILMLCLGYLVTAAAAGCTSKPHLQLGVGGRLALPV